MKFDEIASRLTGLSCPIFGAQWNPPEAQRTVARRVITFLEDRCVLYSPSELEVPEHCVRSMIEIRHFLTQELQKLHKTTELSDGLRALRAACRKFLNAVHAEDDRRIIVYGAERGHYASWIFNSALGEVRGVFGVHVAKLAATYGIDVEDQLAVIIPGLDHEN